MKHYLIIQKTAPFTDYTAQEGIELAMALASFEQPVSLLFMGEGCWQLASTSTSTSSGDINNHANEKSNPNAMDETNSTNNPWNFNSTPGVSSANSAARIAYRKDFSSNLKALRLSGITNVYVNTADCAMRKINLHKLITPATAIDQQQQQQIINTADMVLTVG